VPIRNYAILSVASDGQLLIGEHLGELLHFYSKNGSYKKPFAIPFGAKVIDAVWFLHHIVCATDDYGTQQTVLMSVTGDVISQSQMTSPRCLSVSVDNVIYVTHHEGLSYSSDNGTTWNNSISLRGNGWRFHQALKVTPNGVVSNYTIWMIEYNDYKEWRLSIYTPGNGTWTDVVLPSLRVKVNHSRMFFDGHTNIYMTDFNYRLVHVWSVNGQYVQKLLSPLHLLHRPRNVALNKQRTLLFVSAESFWPSVFAL
jgi:hypothetical protein